MFANCYLVQGILTEGYNKRLADTIRMSFLVKNYLQKIIHNNSTSILQPVKVKSTLKMSRTNVQM